MGRYNSSEDLLWSSEGDLVIDSINTISTLASTKNISYRAFLQQIALVLASEANDWKIESSLNVGLSKFVGLPNNQETGERIKQFVIAALTRNGLVAISDLQVAVFPIGKQTLAIVIRIIPSDTQGQIFLNATYDLRDNKIIIRNL